MNDATRYSLIDRAKTGADQAWSEFWLVYREYVLYRIRRARIPEADVDDVAQNVLMKVQRSLPTFEPRREFGSFRAWLKQIIFQQAADYFRRIERTPGGIATGDSQVLNHLTSNEDSDDDDDVEEIIALYERALFVAEQHFEAETIEAFRLTVINGLTSLEVASQLGKTESAVRMAKSRVLSRLRTALGENHSHPTAQ